jgi:hypothetical protein
MCVISHQGVPQSSYLRMSWLDSMCSIHMFSSICGSCKYERSKLIQNQIVVRTFPLRMITEVLYTKLYHPRAKSPVVFFVILRKLITLFGA